LELPLFPLRTVLFPGMPLPLQVFEERYRAMTRELIASGGRFGVLLIREGGEVGGGAIPYTVGTTARIEEWKELPNGRFVLTARGERRFRLKELLEPRPYPYGEIELFDDTDWERSGELEAALGRVRAEFPEYFQLALSLTGQWARGMRLPRAPHALVDFLAPWLQADEPIRYGLLEPHDALSRVLALRELLTSLLQRARRDAGAHRLQKYRGFGFGN